MKKLRTIAGGIAFLSFFLVVGVVGSLETNNIGWNTGMIYILVGGTVGVIGGLIGFRRD